MRDLTPSEIFDAVDAGLREAALLVALGYQACRGRPTPGLLNDALELRGYGRPIGVLGLDRARPHKSLPDDWVQSVARAVTGQPDTPIGEIIATLNRGASGRGRP